MTMPYEQISDTTYQIDGTLVAVPSGAFDGMTSDQIAGELRKIVADAAEGVAQ